MAAIMKATAVRKSSWSGTPRAMPRRIDAASAKPARIRIWRVSPLICFVSGVCSVAVAWSIPLMWPTWVSMPVVTTRIVPDPRVTWVFMNAMSTRSPRAASAPTASTCFGVGTLSPVSADSSISRVAAERMRASAGTRSPAWRFTTSPGTSWSIGRSTRSPLRRVFAVTASFWLRASAAAAALLSWFRPITALPSVRSRSIRPVKTWPGRKRQMTPAIRRTICIGSAYWRDEQLRARHSLGRGERVRADVGPAGVGLGGGQTLVDVDTLLAQGVVGSEGVPGGVRAPPWGSLRSTKLRPS